MIDWEQLERELADGGFDVDGMASAGAAAARRRERRQLIVVAALAVALLAALVVPLCVVVLRGPARNDDARVPTAASGALRGPSVATRAAVYAAAIAGGAHTPLQRQVWVAGAVCTTVPLRAGPPQGRRCTGQPIPGAVQRRVRTALGSRVTFAARPPLPYRPGDVVVVFLGRLVVNGDRARLGVDTLCGALCGQGGTVLLRRVGGSWRVTGTVGPRWVS